MMFFAVCLKVKKRKVRLIPRLRAMVGLGFILAEILSGRI